MKYGPKTHRKNVDAVLQLRRERKWGAQRIAKQLKLTVGWVSYQLQKLNCETLPKVGTRENLTRAVELRKTGMRWKKIAQELGVENEHSLARAVYILNKLERDYALGN